MKADVLSPAPSRLAIPSWVPEPIAQLVRTMRADDIASLRWESLREGVQPNNAMVLDEAAEIADRYLPLACDPRMQNVWRELTRKKDGAFLRTARNGDQDTALVELLITAVGCRIWRNEATTTRKQAEQERDRWLALADELDRHATTLDSKYLHTLMVAAQAYRDQADKVYTASSVMALKHKHDGRARWVVLTIADACQRLFSLPMYGTTATIASIVLGCDITSRRVQQWWNGRK
jgi:hypothetical protein